MIRINLMRAAVLAAPALSLSPAIALAQPENPECVAPPTGRRVRHHQQAGPGALAEAGILESPLRVYYMPGGIGAVAYSTVVGQRSDEPGTIVAFSGGLLLNLAQGKFGAHDENAVRWVASIATDYGTVVVPADSPWENLSQMMEAIKAGPGSVILGAGGTIGS